MSGRIRTVKPEWLEDELLAAASDEARVLSVALMLMADDYGRGRASLATVAAGAWRYQLEREDGAHAPEILARASRALRELVAIRFVTVYEVSGQRYFAIRTWAKHQRVDRPSKPRIPEPPTTETQENASVAEPSRGSREDVASVSRGSQESLATDLRSPISDLRPVPSTSERQSARSREGVEDAPESVTALAERNRRTVAEGYRSRGLAVPRQAASLAGTAEVAASLAGLPPDALPGILARFFEDGRMREKGYPVAFLLTNANQWASAPRAHSAVSVPETDAERDSDIDRLIAGAAWKPKKEN